MGDTKRGLGTGLSALLGLEEEEANDAVLSVPISRIEPRQDQPRRSFDESSLAELADSIRQYGLIQPITVRKLESGYYQIIAGERRWRASRMAGLTELPVRVIEADERLTTELALVENLQREDLNPLEEALGYKQLIESFGLTQEEAAQRVGKSRPAVANAMRLLNLDPEVAQLVAEGRLSAGHARAIVALPEALQLTAAETALKSDLSVRRTEEMVKKLLSAGEAEAAPAQETVKVDYLGEVSKKLEKSLGRKVKLTESGKRGKIVLEYYGSDDREALIELLERIK